MYLTMQQGADESGEEKQDEVLAIFLNSVHASGNVVEVRVRRGMDRSPVNSSDKTK